MENIDDNLLDDLDPSIDMAVMDSQLLNNRKSDDIVSEGSSEKIRVLEMTDEDL